MIDAKTVEEIEFMLKYCEKKNELYHQYAIDQITRHDKVGRSGLTADELFENTQKCKRAIERIKQIIDTN